MTLCAVQSAGSRLPLAHLKVSEDRIGSALNRLEGLPVLCFGVSLVGLSFFVLEMMYTPLWRPIPIAALIMVFWLVLVFRYASSSSWGQGWYQIMIVFHLIGLLGFGCILLVWWSAIFLLMYFREAPEPLFAQGWATPACTGFLGLGALFILIPYVYRKAKNLQARHQRHWAIRIGQRRTDHPRRRPRTPVRPPEIAD